MQVNLDVNTILTQNYKIFNIDLFFIKIYLKQHCDFVELL